MSIYNLKFKTFGSYTDQILQHANETFSVLHHKFLKEIWHNSITSKLPHNQVETRWSEGTYEVYIPTRDSVESNLKFYRIAIQVLPMLTQENKKTEAYKLMKPLKPPLGDLDSELLILAAPRQNKWGLIRGFKHRNIPGYFTACFVNKSPEIVWKRIITFILNFLEKRINGFMNSLGFEKWLWKYHFTKRHEDALLLIVERFGFVIKQSLVTFMRLFHHLVNNLRGVLHEIGVQNMVKLSLRPLVELPRADQLRVLEALQVEIDNRAVMKSNG